MAFPPVLIPGGSGSDFHRQHKTGNRGRHEVAFAIPFQKDPTPHRPVVTTSTSKDFLQPIYHFSIASMSSVMSFIEDN
jgi:hypothetical protein